MNITNPGYLTYDFETLNVLIGKELRPFRHTIPYRYQYLEEYFGN